jgi:hypothetical protein
MPAKPRVVGASGGASKNQVHGGVRVHLDGQEQRRLAFRHGLEQVVVRGVTGGQGRQLVCELQQQLQPFGFRDGAEFVAISCSRGLRAVAVTGFPRV